MIRIDVQRGYFVHCFLHESGLGLLYNHKPINGIPY